MSIFGSELIPMGKYVAHHPGAERISTDLGDSPEQALVIAYDEDDDCEFDNGDRIAISQACNWVPTVDDGLRIVEDLQEVANEACSDIAEDFLVHVTPEQAADLAQRIQGAVRGWLKEIYPPDGCPFWMCDKTVYQTVNLPPEIVERRAAEAA